MPRPLFALITAGALAFAACSSTQDISGQSADQGGTDAAVTLTVAAGTTTTSSPGPTTSTADAPADTVSATTIAMMIASTVPPAAAVSQADLVRFIAAAETVLKGTSNEGIVYDAPEIYIAIAQAACARFTAGESLQQVAGELLTQLASTDPTDDKRLVGAILGAATQTICPENAGVI